MKLIISVFACMSLMHLVSPAHAQFVMDTETDDHTAILATQEEVDQMYNELMYERDDFNALSGIEALLRFSQTKWNECRHDYTGNYYSSGCHGGRTISVILDRFLGDHLVRCVDAGLEAQGGGRASSVHIVHAGITADPRHSPRSLHSENRAIDVKVLHVALTNGGSRQFTFALSGNRPFYTAFRSCWGDTVNRYNGCPIYNGMVGRTGTIGWENANHTTHMHVSVPYCVNGRYAGNFYQR